MLYIILMKMLQNVTSFVHIFSELCNVLVLINVLANLRTTFFNVVNIFLYSKPFNLRIELSVCPRV